MIFAGAVWAAFLGLVLGNFATNPLFRLPRKLPLFEKDPFCDTCKKPLKPRDLFPVFSWLIAKGKCRYCKAPIPGIYTFIETFSALLFVVAYFRFGFSEIFLLITLGVLSLVLLLEMLVQKNYFSDPTWVVCVMLGMLYRTLHDHTLYNFLGSAFAALLIGLLLARLSKHSLTRDLRQLPPYVKLLVAAGVWLPLQSLFILVGLFAVTRLCVRTIAYMPECIIVVMVMAKLLIHT